MDVKGKPITVYADDEFLASLDAWAKKEQVSRSLAVRQIVSEFFERGGTDAI